MAVIKDVAKLAGVSVGTVSNYLNCPENVGEKYRIRVENAINELQYKPSLLARSMRTRKTNHIGLIVPEIANDYYAQVYNAVRAAAFQYGYTPILYSIEENLDVLKGFLEDISIQQVDGLILCFLDEDEIMRSFEEIQKKIPVTLMSWDINNTKFNSVIIDVFEGIYKATKHVIDLGHKDIAYIAGGPKSSIFYKEKFLGYKKAMEEAGYEIKDEYLGSGKYRFQTGFQSTRNFMRLNSPPTAIVAANDVLAVGSAKFLISKGIKIPDEVAVIGFDGIPLASIYEPGISTVAQPFTDMGAEAVRLLLAKIEKPGSKNKQIILGTELIVRKSTNANAYVEFEL